MILICYRFSGGRRGAQLQRCRRAAGHHPFRCQPWIRRLEDGFQTLLVMRTTRSVRLTEAGERLHKSLLGPIANIEAAFDDVTSDSMPRGQLRIAVTSIAEAFLSGPLLASFAAAHPAVSLDVFVSDEEFDIVAAGYDAGVRLGEVIEKT